jgi:hypothetical protein
MIREGSWSKSNSYWGTSKFKPPNGTLGASNGFVQRLMIALALSRILELGGTVMEEWPTIFPELPRSPFLESFRFGDPQPE